MVKIVQLILHIKHQGVPPSITQTAKFDTGIFPLDPQCVLQISAKLEHTYVTYSDFCKVC